jgi:signal transduction histidine kinase
LSAVRIFGTSLRLRLALWYSVAFFLLLGGSSLAVFFSVRGSWDRSVAREQEQDFSTVRAVLGMSPVGMGANGHLPGDVLFLVMENGRIVFHSAAMCSSGYCHEIYEPGVKRDGVWRSTEGLQVALKSAIMNVAGHDYAVTVGVDIGPMNTHLSSLTAILLATLGGGLVLSLLFGYVMAGRALAPLGRMAEKARRIGVENMSERLPVEKPDDELGRMASVFNQTLERLESSFRQLNEFTANVSHELRTPLTAIRSVGEVALHSDRDAPRYREAIGSMLEESDHLARLVENLLTLARAEAGRLPLTPEPIDPSSIVESAVELLGVLAEEKGQTIRTDLAAGLSCRVDVTTMKQVLINVLGNAMRFTPVGGCIRLATRASGDKAVVEVIDEAPRIPKADRERVFSRFNGTGAGGNRRGGTGLGLSISRWVVELNGGSIAFDDAPGRGNLCRITLPLIPKA